MLVSIINLFFVPAICVVVGYGIAKERPYVTFLRYAISTVLMLVFGKLMEKVAKYVINIDISVDEVQYTFFAIFCAVILGVLIKIVRKYVESELDIRRKENEK